jgi:hypothetical protein
VKVTSHLREALRDKFQPPEWLMAYEVQAERQEGGLRFADAVAIRTAKARVEVLGFELKVSRGDWLNELRKPGKADAARSLVDAWYVVTGKPGIVAAQELPAGAGLMSVHGGVLQVDVPATVRERIAPIDRALLGAFLRRLDPMEPRAYWESRERRAEQKGYARGQNAGRRVAGTIARRPTKLVDNAPLNLP